MRCGNPIGGLAGALYAAAGILAALARRRRTEGGATLDIALFDAQLAMNAYRVPPALGAGRRYAPEPHRGGNGAMPYGPFRARCGHWFPGRVDLLDLGRTAQLPAPLIRALHGAGDP